SRLGGMIMSHTRNHACRTIWRKLRPGLLLLALATGAGCSREEAGSALSSYDYGPIQPTLTSIEIQPADHQSPVNEFIYYSATGTYDDGSSRELKELCDWKSSTRKVASFAIRKNKSNVGRPITNTAG